MKTQTIQVTPKKAAEWLQNCNTHNRNINKSRVTQYAADMKAGSWMLSHQGIAFDEDGVLCDGQHRLAAIVLADVTLPMLVTTGLPRELANGVVIDIRDVMDRGQGRSVGQQLAMSHGVKYSNHVSASIRTIASICVGRDMAMSTAQTLKIMGIYGENVEEIVNLPWIKGQRKTIVMGTLAFAMSVDRPKVTEFATSLATMINIPAKSPVMALHRWLLRAPAVGGNRIEFFSKAVASCVCRYIDGLPADKVIGSEEAMKRLRAGQKAKVRQVCEIMGVA